MQARSLSFTFLVMAVLSAGAAPLPSAEAGEVGGMDLTDLPEESRSLVEFADRALEYVRENGRERALEEFNDPRGQFVVGDLRYVFAYDSNGTCLAQPFRPGSVGKNQIDLRDENGFLFVRNLNRLASQGGGFAYYVRPNPLHHDSPELKLSYIARVDDDWWLGTGVWLSDVSAVFSADARLDLVSFVDGAVDYARENERKRALEAFNDKNGSFVDGNQYLFAYDFDENRVLAHPFQPDLVGKVRRGGLDIYGFAMDPSVETGLGGIREVARDGTGLVYYMYLDPARDTTPAIKLGYVRAVDDDWWLGSGIYPAEGDQFGAEGASSSYQPPATKEELAAFVEAAASFARIFGRDLATKDFMDLQGPFVRGDVYIFAADFNGTSLALPFLPSAVGTNRLDLQNSEGVRINREMRSIAEDGSGFFEYLWTNPLTGGEEPKTSYVTKVDDGWWLGAGIYLEGWGPATEP